MKASRVCAFLLLALCRSAVADCAREYVLPHQAGGTRDHQIRFVDGSWEIGFGDWWHLWEPLGCEPKLDTDFLDGTNTGALQSLGEAHEGKFSSFVFYPQNSVPAGVTFSLQGAHPRAIRQLSFPELGWALLDRRHYRERRQEIGGLKTHIYSEPNNPAQDAARLVIATMAKLLPHAAAKIRRQGPITIVLARNSTEAFKPGSVVLPNGIHDPRYRFAVLFSQDGVGDFKNPVLEHSFHEIGGLFQIPEPSYARGLSWMVAYDQMEKLAGSAEEQKAYHCLDVQRVIWNLRATITESSDAGSQTVETFVDLRGAKGFPMFAWGSGFYWKEINTALVAAGVPDVYALMDGVHAHGLPEPQPGEHALDRLLAAYPDGPGAELFRSLAARYFRQEKLTELLDEAVAEQGSLGCGR